MKAARLIGRAQYAEELGDIEAFLRPLFEAIEAEVRRTGGGLRRCVGYEAVGEREPLEGEAALPIRIFGMLVAEETETPPGFSAWELGADWRKLRLAAPDGSCRQYRVFATTWVGEHGPDDDIELAEYDSEWPSQFERLRECVRGLLGDELALRIEHYGSTAVPVLAAKPVIDVLVEVPTIERGFDRALEVFGGVECECWRFEDDALVILRERPLGKRVAHIHLAPAGHEIWRGLQFRDWLRAHPEDARRYEVLKRRLAEQLGTDRGAYTRAKGEFVREVLELAARTRGESA